jgi:hypothetical protein
VWILVLIFLGPDLFNIQELNQYATWKECQAAQKHVAHEMSEAYKTTDFRIECKCPSCTRLIV